MVGGFKKFPPTCPGRALSSERRAGDYSHHTALPTTVTKLKAILEGKTLQLDRKYGRKKYGVRWGQTERGQHHPETARGPWL